MQPTGARNEHLNRSKPVQVCIRPNAPEVKCASCSKLVKTCSGLGQGICPVHPDGIKFGDNKWACSEECYHVAIGQTMTTPFNLDTANYEVH